MNKRIAKSQLEKNRSTIVKQIFKRIMFSRKLKRCLCILSILRIIYKWINIFFMCWSYQTNLAIKDKKKSQNNVSSFVKVSQILRWGRDAKLAGDQFLDAFLFHVDAIHRNQMVLSGMFKALGPWKVETSVKSASAY